VSGQESQEQSARKDTAGYPGSVVQFPGGFDGGHPPNNLPLQLSSFVGRDREVAEIDALLADHRLLTLTGPGGSGKTRLALAVAHEVGGSYEDGVWLVELAPLSDPELVLQALASILGVREAPGSPLIETLADHLGSKTVLIVLDNCGGRRNGHREERRPPSRPWSMRLNRGRRSRIPRQLTPPD
jgi:AAA domain